MKVSRRWFVGGAAAACGTALGAWWRWFHGPPEASAAPKCAHWCLVRVCELFGIPLGIAEAERLLGTGRKGHTMSQLASVLGTLGLTCVGRRVKIEELATVGFPLVVHLAKPNHFLVLTGMGKDYFRGFDGGGEWCLLPRDQVASRWTGYVLRVDRATGDCATPASAPRAAVAAPYLRFRALCVDAGHVSDKEQVVKACYPFRNLGNAPLLIQAVETDCGCVTSYKPDTPVLPGASAHIELEFRAPVTGGGSFAHRAVVKSNDPRLPLAALRLVGESFTRFRVTPEVVDFGEIVFGRPATARVLIRHDPSLEGLAIRGLRTTLASAHVDATVVGRGDIMRDFGSQLRENHCRGAGCAESFSCITLQLTPAGRGERSFIERIYVTACMAGNIGEIVLSIRGRVVAPIALAPSVVDFGEVKNSEIYHRTTTLVPRINDRYRIEEVLPEVRGVRFSFQRNWAREATALDVSGDGTALAAASGSTVTVKCRFESGDELSSPLELFARSPAQSAAPGGQSRRDGTP
ncbi:MAG: DUF1573 domain-containing protein [Thermoguttaceae bacterium]